MKSLYAIIALALLSLSMNCAVVFAQQADYPYAPPWFGPHALPPPPMGAAIISEETELGLQGSSLVGGAHTSHSLHIDAEVPLVARAVSVRLWGAVQEYYRLTDEQANLMGVSPQRASGWEGGDYYLQTRIRLLPEQRMYPSLVLNLTLKTAASATASTRRFYDTPGYYFSLEVGKDWLPRTADGLWLRTALQLGFLCWETGLASRQNDAYMYGAQLLVGWRELVLGTDLSGYTGWMQGHPHYRPDYGDRPLLWRTTLAYQLSTRCALGVDLACGLKNYPYTLLGLNLRMRLPRLTPRLR